MVWSETSSTELRTPGPSDQETRRLVCHGDDRGSIGLAQVPWTYTVESRGLRFFVRVRFPLSNVPIGV